MPTPDSPDATRAHARLLPASAAVAAFWLGTLSGMAQQDGQRVSWHASATLEQAARHLKSLPGRADGVALAAQGTQEGHWRFVNRAGEMFTVGTPDEMKRVVAVLYPDAKANARVSLYLTEDTVFRRRAALKSLPANAELNMVAGGMSHRLQRRSEGEPLFAEVRANVGVETRDERLFADAVWQLARPLGRARVRVLALEPGGPWALSGSPRMDPAAKGALIDAIDPARLVAAMGSVVGQVLLIAGRRDGDVLYVRPASGPEHGLPVSDILRAAAEAEVNLIVLLTASTPRQPSGRNGLWNPPSALQPAQVADLLGGIAGRNRYAAILATAAGGRTALDVTLGGDLSGALPARAVNDRLSAIVADISGRAGVTGVQMNLLAAERQSELDRRLLPGIPAAVQAGYAALVVLGLLGMPVARGWWVRIWPPEAAAEYAGRSGYWAACAVRGLVFLAVFVPATAVATGPYNLARQIGDAVRRPGRGWRWHRDVGGADAEALDPRGRKGAALDEARMRRA
jgi:hypothetical protein